MMAQNAILTLPTILVAFEERYRGDHAREHALLLDSQGREVARHIGDYDSVDFKPEELEQARNGLLTHTHPRCLPPSGADLALAAEYGLTLRAVGNAPDTGQQFDHTVHMPVASKQLARRIGLVYDDYIEQAERELSHEPSGDLQWQRESRHLALTRLAEHFGFSYSRVDHASTLSEMARHEQARLDVLAGVDSALKSQVFDVLRQQVVTILTRNADERGRIPLTRLPHVQQLAGAQAVQMMVGKPVTNGIPEPYLTKRGEVIPNSLFFAVLWGLMRKGAGVAIERHAALMRKYLPEDLARQFEFATISPFRSPLAEEEGDETFAPLDYDPLHLWIGPDGKQLSDRIWNAAGDLRRRLNEYLTQAIARGLPVQQMAQELEPFLLPGNGAYEAYRLARTEVSAAVNRADSAAAQMNPLVETYSVRTAPRHKCCDNCDDEEAGSPYSKADMTHLPPFHPLCICGVIWNMVEDVAATVASLRDQIARAVAQAKKSIVDFINPLSKRFIDLLFRGRS